MDHGRHCECGLCKMGKAVGMIKKCQDENCHHESHKKGEEKKEAGKEE